MTPPLDVFGKPLDFGTQDGEPPVAGHCCHSLVLFWTFDDWVRCYEAASARLTTWTRADGTRHELIPDVLTIAPMLRKVGVCASNPLAPELPFSEPRKVWRCAHQRDDFTCAIYDRRPAMCRTYPSNADGGRCEFYNCNSTVCQFRPTATKENSDADRDH